MIPFFLLFVKRVGYLCVILRYFYKQREPFIQRTLLSLSICARVYDYVFRVRTANRAFFRAFALCEHPRRSARFRFDFILAVATTAPTRFNEVSVVYARQNALHILRVNDTAIPPLSRRFQHVLLHRGKQLFYAIHGAKGHAGIGETTAG